MYCFSLKVGDRVVASGTVRDEEVIDVASALHMYHPDPDTDNYIVPKITRTGNVEVSLVREKK